jgi:hypothetical protein
MIHARASGVSETEKILILAGIKNLRKPIACLNPPFGATIAIRSQRK